MVFHYNFDFFLFRASELEVENEKLRKEFLLLRNSINRGVAQQELEGLLFNK